MTLSPNGKCKHKLCRCIGVYCSVLRFWFLVIFVLRANNTFLVKYRMGHTTSTKPEAFVKCYAHKLVYQIYEKTRSHKCWPLGACVPLQNDQSVSQTWAGFNDVCLMTKLRPKRRAEGQRLRPRQAIITN